MLWSRYGRSDCRLSRVLRGVRGAGAGGDSHRHCLRLDVGARSYFRVVHLVMIAIVVGEALAGAPCPLTIWEKQLRMRAGQATYPGDFLGYWVHRLIFYQAEPWVFTLSYAIFGLAVVAALVLAPPRLHAARAHNLNGPPPQPAR